MSEDDVVAHWLEQELEDEETELAVDELDAERRLSELLRRKPVAVRVFDDSDLDWYLVDLREEELGGARVIKGDDDEGWREAAPEDTIHSAAQVVHDAQSAADGDDSIAVEDLDADHPKDLDTVLGVADDAAAGEPMDELILAGDEDPPFVIDGNHRAVGVVLHGLRGEEFPAQPAFVGVEPRD